MSSQKMKAQVVIIQVVEKTPHLLLLQTNSKRGEFWQNVTGSVEKDETFEQGALRELEEETGFKVHSQNLIDLKLEFQFRDRWDKEVTEKSYLYKEEVSKLKTPVLDPSEHQNYQWIEVKDVKEDHYQYPSNYKAFQKCLEYL